MKSIKENLTNELIIKNSKFIANIYKISNSNINDYLDNIKKEYPKATHYCYAYIYNDIKKSSDDGEPTNTAGMPLLNVLEKENLNNILVIVVRYFGGIKLGAGGLIRAYTKSLTEALKQAKYINLEPGYKITISFDYNNEKQVNYLLEDSNIIEKEYKDKIKYQVLVNKNILEKLHNYDYEILEEVYIEKDSN